MSQKSYQPSRANSTDKSDDAPIRGHFEALTACVEEGWFRNVKPTAAIIWFVLSKYADSSTGRCWVKATTIAEDLGLTDPSHVHTAIAELRKMGMVSERDKRGNFYLQAPSSDGPNHRIRERRRQRKAEMLFSSEIGVGVPNRHYCTSAESALSECRISTSDSAESALSTVPNQHLYLPTKLPPIPSNDLREPGDDRLGVLLKEAGIDAHDTIVNHPKCTADRVAIVLENYHAEVKGSVRNKKRWIIAAIRRGDELSEHACEARERNRLAMARKQLEVDPAADEARQRTAEAIISRLDDATVESMRIEVLAAMNGSSQFFQKKNPRTDRYLQLKIAELWQQQQASPSKKAAPA